MHRRSYLIALSASLTLAGCPSAGGENGSFSVSSPRVEQGKSANIAITADDINSLKFASLPDEVKTPTEDGFLEVQFERADFTPAPDFIWQSFPPTWDWQSSQNVTGEVPINTSTDTPPDTYQITIAINWKDSEGIITKQANITVE